MVETKKKVQCFIDGFNLYHAIDDLKQPQLKWLNLWDLTLAFIKPSSEQLKDVFYFTARPEWLKAQLGRHDAYMAALQVKGVTTMLGQFKQRDRNCRRCGARWKAHEEKESDVNLAVQLVHNAYQERFDRAFIITADSDLIPPIKLVRDQFPNKEIVLLTPPGRYKKTREFQSIVNVIKIGERHLKSNLLPEVVKDSNGELVACRPQAYT